MKFITQSVILGLLVTIVCSQSCPEPDAYYPDSQQCDRYIKCTDGVPEEMLCPDGLVFNEALQKVRFPCDYPVEVDCGSRTKLQPAQPTERCSRAWGYFGTGDSADCGRFWNCVDRREFEFSCPEGLAFSSATYRCEYPGESPDCNAEAYLGFSCPAVRDESQVLLVGIPRYASPRDCRKYFLCIGSSPRMQTCYLGTVFNDDTHGCDEPENVQGCSDYYPAEELAAIRDRKAKRQLAQARRLKQQQERFAALNPNRKLEN